jgi:hypothetical protein
MRLFLTMIRDRTVPSVLLVAGMLLVTHRGFAQMPVAPDAGVPELPKRASSTKELVPPGWRVEIEESGDLNRDGVPDLVLVLRPAGEKAEADVETRLLLVAMAKAAGYQLVLAESRLLSRSPRRGRALSEKVLIENGLLRLFLDDVHPMSPSQRTTRAFDFRFQNSRFELIRFDLHILERFSQRSTYVSIDYVDHKASLTDTFERPMRKQQKMLPPGSPPTIETLGDAWMFHPEACELGWWKTPPARARSKKR